MDLKFYGGVNQIGGNKILVRDSARDVSVFLDFGMNFTQNAKYFEEFIRPRSSNGIVDFIEMGIIPKLVGIYRRDLLEFAGMKTHDEPSVDAVMLSHAHLDHSSHITFLDERIPVYCSETTYAIMKAIQETGRRDIGSEIIDFKRRPILNYRERPVERKFVMVDKKVVIDGLEIEFIPVDHSVPGAVGMIIHGSDATIAYSGDLRMHGTDGRLTREFVERLAAVKPDIFLCEGTRIDETDRNSEQYVRENSMKAISGAKGLVVADFAFKDTTRFKTFLEIARATGRRLAIEFKDAYYVRELSKHVGGLPDLRDESLLLYEGKKGSGTYREGDYEEWEREFLDFPNAVRADYVTKHQGEVISALGYYDVPELVDIRPDPRSLYIKSASEAFNEEQEIDMVRLRAWLDHFGMLYDQIHASGHAPREDLGYVMRGSGAKTIMPIHTEHADQFASLANTSILMPTLQAG
jgi:ribonuclease J